MTCRFKLGYGAGMDSGWRMLWVAGLQAGYR
jgi:hypothetical protein